MEESFATKAQRTMRIIGKNVYDGVYLATKTFCGDVVAMFKLWSMYIFSHLETKCPDRDPTITAVYAFCEDTPPSIDDDPDWTDVLKVPVDQFSFETFEDATWKPAEWTSYRVEVRYVYMNKKYRIVLRRGERAVLPPCRAEEGKCGAGAGGGRAKIRLPRGVLSARLASRDEDPTDDIDITGRVKKYAGPWGNFHATSLRVRDMFPFDDHESNADRFAGVRIVDAWGRTKLFSYVDNDVVALQPPPSFAMPDALKSKDE
jgi:hypothetical protein